MVLVASTSLQTDSAQPFPGLDSKLTVIRPVPYLAAFVISSLAINPSETFALKQYLEDLCRDFSMMLSSERPERVIAVEGIEIELPAVTAIPLGFIASELITNATKYGTGRITVRLEANPAQGYALSVANDGPALPEGFDPAVGKGLGMRIIRSLVERIGGELRIGRGDMSQGTRFTVLFS